MPITYVELHSSASLTERDAQAGHLVARVEYNVGSEVMHSVVFQRNAGADAKQSGILFCGCPPLCLQDRAEAFILQCTRTDHYQRSYRSKMPFTSVYSYSKDSLSGTHSILQPSIHGPTVPCGMTLLRGRCSKVFSTATC